MDFDIENVIALHASAVYDEHGALLFLGPSGTGKSTMVRLLGPYMQPLAEDIVWVAPRPDGGWEVFSLGPQTFSSADLATVPLRAVFRLYQAPEPMVEKLDVVAHCRYLTDAFFEFFRPRGSLAEKQRAFESLARIARTIPGYVFYFDLSPRTPAALGDVLRRYE